MSKRIRKRAKTVEDPGRRISLGAARKRAKTVRLSLGAGLQKVLGGTRTCLEHELVPLLMARELAVPVTTHGVSVTTMEGSTLCVKMDQTDCSVKCLKSRIENLRGCASWSQQLFYIGQDRAVPLADTHLLKSACSLALCVDCK